MTAARLGVATWIGGLLLVACDGSSPGMATSGASSGGASESGTTGTRSAGSTSGTTGATSGSSSGGTTGSSTASSGTGTGSASNSGTASAGSASSGSGAASGGTTGAQDFSQIKHVFIIYQENRSFDHYFGTFPGANGFPVLKDGGFAPCVPQVDGGACVHVFHDTADVNAGGPHFASAFIADVDDGGMDGFVQSQERALVCDAGDNDPKCANDPEGVSTHDVMGYHDDREIPNYWAYAQSFVLHDNFYEPNASWSLPSHLFLVSEWAAHCTLPDGGQSSDPNTCVSDINLNLKTKQNEYAWTDLTYLLHNAGVSWKNYLVEGSEPDCDDGAMTCDPVPQLGNVPSIWNILPQFTTV